MSHPMRAALLLFLTTALAWTASAQAAPRLLSDRQPDERPTLLVLGTAHFANPGRDRIDVRVEDVLAERRQREIAAVVDQLAAFRPTHVAVEWAVAEQAALDARYSDFRNKRLELGRNEVDQIGLRLAAMLDLQHVHAVDWNDYPPGDFDKHYDWSKYAEAHGQQALLEALDDPKRVTSRAPQLAEQSIATWLRQLNEPASLAASHRAYFDIALIGDVEQQPGANYVGHWYARNLRIFGNLVRLAQRPTDRILAVYGQGHAYLLRQFAVESGAFRVADVAQVLSREGG
jgi:hypothetical protein